MEIVYIYAAKFSSRETDVTFCKTIYMHMDIVVFWLSSSLAQEKERGIYWENKRGFSVFYFLYETYWERRHVVCIVFIQPKKYSPSRAFAFLPLPLSAPSQTKACQPQVSEWVKPGRRVERARTGKHTFLSSSMMMTTTTMTTSALVLMLLVGG